MSPPRRRHRILLAAVVVLLTLPTLSVGLFHDDLLHRLLLEEAVPSYRRGPHQLYDFLGDGEVSAPAMRDQGFLPWTAADDLRLRFFRPLSSLLHAVDHALFGRAALPAHLHSLLWFVLLGVCVALLYRRVVDRRSAMVALAIYLMAGVHASPLGWLAARHTLVSAVLTAAALLAHVSARQDGRPARVGLSVLLAGAGLLASETTLAIVPLVVLYELMVRRDERLGRRLGYAAPVTVLGLVYLVFYGVAAYGTSGSAAYISPFDDPLAYGQALFLRAPPLMAQLYGGVPVMLWSMAAPVRVLLWVLGLVAFLGTVALLRSDRSRLDGLERRHLAWLAAASIACLAPMVGTVLDGRLLAVAAIGSAPVLAAALVHGWRAARRARGWRRWGGRIGVVLLGFGAFGLSPLVRVGLSFAMGEFSAAGRRLAETAELGACEPGDHLYLLTASDPMLALYTEQSLIFHAPERRARYGRVRVLSMAPHPQTLRGIEGGFELAVDAPEREHTLFEQVYREAPFVTGERLRVEELQVTVLDAEGAFPNRVRFEPDEPHCLLHWDGERLAPLPAPAPGETVAIPRRPGPMGL